MAPRQRRAAARYDPDAEAAKPQLAAAAPPPRGPEAAAATRLSEAVAPLKASNPSYAQLRALCGLHGLSTQGRAPELLRRIDDHLSWSIGFSVGDRVRALFPDGKPYPATVAAVSHGGGYTVNWDDGDDQHRERARHEVLPPAAWAEVAAALPPSSSSSSSSSASAAKRRRAESAPVPEGVPGRALAGGEDEAARPKRSRPDRASVKYATQHCLLERDACLDGFYDAGRAAMVGGGPSSSPSLPSLSELAAMPLEAAGGSGREVVVLDSRTDPALAALRERVVAAVRLVQSERAAVLVVALLVANQLGGSSDSWAGGLADCERAVAALRAARGSNLLPLGLLRQGCCRHRAVLFKYLMDHLNRSGGADPAEAAAAAAPPPLPFLPLRCRLVRGHFYPDGDLAADRGHAWNCVWLPTSPASASASASGAGAASGGDVDVDDEGGGGAWHVVDVMHEPTLVYEEASLKAQQYRRLAASGAAGGEERGDDGQAGRRREEGGRGLDLSLRSNATVDTSIHAGGAGLNSLRMSSYPSLRSSCSSSLRLSAGSAASATAGVAAAASQQPPPLAAADGAAASGASSCRTQDGAQEPAALSQRTNTAASSGGGGGDDAAAAAAAAAAAEGGRHVRQRVALSPIARQGAKGRSRGRSLRDNHRGKGTAAARGRGRGKENTGPQAASKRRPGTRGGGQAAAPKRGKKRIIKARTQPKKQQQQQRSKAAAAMFIAKQARFFAAVDNVELDSSWGSLSGTTGPRGMAM